MFIVVGISQFSRYNISGQPIFAKTPVLFFFAGAFWVIGGVRVGGLQKLPPPVTAPVFDAVIRPLPGEQEGFGAGWFAVSGQITRWWTGTRWSPYVVQKVGVRPTQYGPRAYRASMIVGGVLAGLGVLAALLGFALVGAVGWWAAAIAVIPGMVFVFTGGLVMRLIYIRRYTMILPPQAPPLS